MDFKTVMIVVGMSSGVLLMADVVRRTRSDPTPISSPRLGLSFLLTNWALDAIVLVYGMGMDPYEWFTRIGARYLPMLATAKALCDVRDAARR